MSNLSTPSPEQRAELAPKVKRLADCYAEVSRDWHRGKSRDRCGDMSFESEIDRERMSPQCAAIIPADCTPDQASSRARKAQQLHDWLKDSATEGKRIPPEYEKIFEEAMKLS